MSERDAAHERAGDRRGVPGDLGRPDRRRLRARPRRAAELGAAAGRVPRQHDREPVSGAARAVSEHTRLRAGEEDTLLLGLDLVKDVARLAGRLPRPRRRDGGIRPKCARRRRTASSTRRSSSASSPTSRAGIPSTSGWTSASARRRRTPSRCGARAGARVRRGRAAARRGQLEVPATEARSGARACGIQRRGLVDGRGGRLRGRSRRPETDVQREERRCLRARSAATSTRSR